MKRIAAPMVGGMISSTVLTLMVIPAIYSLWKEWEVTRHDGRARRTRAEARRIKIPVPSLGRPLS
jgi:hypothetical protein